MTHSSQKIESPWLNSSSLPVCCSDGTRINAHLGRPSSSRNENLKRITWEYYHCRVSAGKRSICNELASILPGTSLEITLRDCKNTAKHWTELLIVKCGNVLEVRMPSLMFDQQRRFAYLQMASGEEATAGLELDGRETEGEYTLSVAISDPSAKRGRSDAA